MKWCMYDDTQTIIDLLVEEIENTSFKVVDNQLILTLLIKLDKGKKQTVLELKCDKKEIDLGKTINVRISWLSTTLNEIFSISSTNKSIIV